MVVDLTTTCRCGLETSLVSAFSGEEETTLLDHNFTGCLDVQALGELRWFDP